MGAFPKRDSTADYVQRMILAYLCLDACARLIAAVCRGHGRATWPSSRGMVASGEPRSNPVSARDAPPRTRTETDRHRRLCGAPTIRSPPTWTATATATATTTARIS
jgi:hypothetical protein